MGLSEGVWMCRYEGLRFRREALLPIRWGYAILDEGHKIRNPDADITLVAKQLQTVHRVIMSGSPIQVSSSCRSNQGISYSFRIMMRSYFFNSNGTQLAGWDLD